MYSRSFKGIDVWYGKSKRHILESALLLAYAYLFERDSMDRSIAKKECHKCNSPQLKNFLLH